MMRKVILAITCCMTAWTAQAREVTYNVYYNEITQIRGELYLYSELYLGTTDVILEDSHSYELDKIKLVTSESSYGVISSSSQGQDQNKSSVKEQLPLSEETLMATNLAKKAESVAKQIYRIRETRLNILAGDVEHMPADGKAMQVVLDELSKQEKALTSMFVGKTIVQNHRQSVSVNINDTATSIQMPLLKFDNKLGVLESDSEQGKPVTISIVRTTEPVLAPIQPKRGGPKYEDKIISSKTIITYLNKTIYAQTCNL